MSRSTVVLIILAIAGIAAVIFFQQSLSSGDPGPSVEVSFVLSSVQNRATYDMSGETGALQVKGLKLESADKDISFNMDRRVEISELQQENITIATEIIPRGRYNKVVLSTSVTGSVDGQSLELSGEKLVYRRNFTVMNNSRYFMRTGVVKDEQVPQVVVFSSRVQEASPDEN